MNNDARPYTLGYLKAFLVILEVILILYCIFTGLIFATLVPVPGRLTSVVNRSQAIHERTRYGYYSFKNTILRVDYEYIASHQHYWGHRISPLIAYATTEFSVGPVTVYYSRVNPAYSTLEGFDGLWYLGNNLPLGMNSIFLWCIRLRKTTRRTFKT